MQTCSSGVRLRRNPLFSVIRPRPGTAGVSVPCHPRGFASPPCRNIMCSECQGQAETWSSSARQKMEAAARKPMRITAVPSLCELRLSIPFHTGLCSMSLPLSAGDKSGSPGAMLEESALIISICTRGGASSVRGIPVDLPCSRGIRGALSASLAEKTFCSCHLEGQNWESVCCLLVCEYQRCPGGGMFLIVERYADTSPAAAGLLSDQLLRIEDF